MFIHISDNVEGFEEINLKLFILTYERIMNAIVISPFKVMLVNGRV